ncbi:hypothetical protein AVEN_234307-1 [Araneus ventricosus]|uniref:Uncharacterized protein n=1 Tax=Araneus ventricosus TaxID=182803 RepID=A0A4Y2A812_ARAVE|nr:hypothetical protein AVEN_234307-1 [Araneus ventricosus]
MDPKSASTPNSPVTAKSSPAIFESQPNPHHGSTSTSSTTEIPVQSHQRTAHPHEKFCCLAQFRINFQKAQQESYVPFLTEMCSSPSPEFNEVLRRQSIVRLSFLPPVFRAFTIV